MGNAVAINCAAGFLAIDGEDILVFGPFQA